MDAIDRAGVHACSIFRSDAGFGNDICHSTLPKTAYLFQLYHTGMAGVRQRLNYPTQDHDVVIDRGQVGKGKKKPSNEPHPAILLKKDSIPTLITGAPRPELHESENSGSTSPKSQDGTAKIRVPQLTRICRPSLQLLLSPTAPSSTGTAHVVRAPSPV